jgi:hypothetical protein
MGKHRDSDPPADTVSFTQIGEQAATVTYADRPPAAQEQIDRALHFLIHRGAPDQRTTVARAAIIVLARPNAPSAEQILGMKSADPALFGQEVICRDCDRTWTCQPEDDYYDGCGSTTAGICFGCLLIASRLPSPAGPPVLTPPPEAVTPPTRSERARRRQASRKPAD